MAINHELYEVESGGIVSIYNQDFVVEQAVKLNTGSVNYLIKDGRVVKWLCIRNPGEPVAVLCDQVVLEADEFGPSLHHNGVEYTLFQKGSARAITTSSMGYPRYINLEYYDYAAADNQQYLFIVKGSEQLTVAAGLAVIGSGIMVFPKPN
jgi:hypothetical protein